MYKRQLYNCKEIANRYQVKEVTVWSWIRSGKLQAIKPSKNYLVKESELARFENEKTTA